jgi:hypothetical protein
MSDEPQDPGAAGAGSEEGAASIEDRAKNGEHLEAVGPPPIGGDAQLSLSVGPLLEKTARRVLGATISLSSGERTVDGLFRFDVEYPFLVVGKAGPVTDVPIQDPKTQRTKGVKKRQRIEVARVRRADDPEVIRELFDAVLAADPAGAGALLEALGTAASATLAQAA